MRPPRSADRDAPVLGPTRRINRRAYRTLTTARTEPTTRSTTSYRCETLGPRPVPTSPRLANSNRSSGGRRPALRPGGLEGRRDDAQIRVVGAQLGHGRLGIRGHLEGVGLLVRPVPAADHPGGPGRHDHVDVVRILAEGEEVQAVDRQGDGRVDLRVVDQPDRVPLVAARSARRPCRPRLSGGLGDVVVALVAPGSRRRRGSPRPPRPARLQRDARARRSARRAPGGDRIRRLVRRQLDGGAEELGHRLLVLDVGDEAAERLVRAVDQFGRDPGRRVAVLRVLLEQGVLAPDAEVGHPLDGHAAPAERLAELLGQPRARPWPRIAAGSRSGRSRPGPGRLGTRRRWRSARRCSRSPGRRSGGPRPADPRRPRRGSPRRRAGPSRPTLPVAGGASASQPSSSPSLG